MSLGARATKGGAKGKDRAHDKGHDKPQPKEKVKPQATTEQLRMANMIDRKGDDTADVRKMVQDLMETTCRTEEEVCSALHDADNDVFAACNILLEADNTPTGEWQTNEKKKKKPPAPANNGEPEPPRDRSRSGPRPRRGSGERGEQSSRGRGGGRGGRGGARGGRGGARGGRGGSRPRPDRHHEWPHQNMQDSNPMGDGFPATEDWDNEEWSGSLSDTKVFTPSVPAPALDGDCGPPAEDWDAAEPPDHIPTYTYHNPAAQLPAAVEVPAPVNSEVPAAASVNAAPAPAEYLQPMGMSGSLSAAQSHYLSQLTQQHHHDNSMYSPSYGVYGADVTQRKPQRARVPPPSKIPVSAVEMPGGGGADSQFLDVQFGATDDPIDPPKAAAGAPLAPPASEGAPPPRDSPPHIDPPAVYSAHNNIQLIESLSVSEPHPAAPAPAPAPPAAPPAVSAASASLEKQLSASMKQLSVSAEASPHAALPHHRPAKSAALNMYSHHPVSHHPPPVYSANVYAPQVNSSTASLSAGAGYPASAAMTQYQPALNNYQTSAGAAAAYSSGALYTAAPYTPYQPPAHPPLKHHPPKDTHQQYEAASAPASSSLASTATTQPAAAKVTTTTGAASAVSGAGGAVSVSGAAAAAGGGAAGAAYGGGALYGASQTYAPYDDQLMRSTMTHHMGAYYEVAGYGVGVGVGGGARDPAFSLGAGERFTRTDASSPQQVPTPTLPPGYAYYTYQPPPPTTYQYGVYPFGAGSNVGAGGKVGSYQQQQQPPYDAQDSYKTVSGGGVSSYSGGAGKGGAAGDLTAAIYPKQHVALNKVNSYEKAGFHSGTPPPFGAGSHLYIPAPPHHHHHQPQQHQESAGSGGRAPAAKQTHSKPYAHSYWPNN